MVPVPATPGSSAAPYLLVRVYNRGSAPTTLMALTFEFWPSSVSRLLAREPEYFFVPLPQPNPTPALVEPGREWTTIVVPNPILDRARNGGVLVCRIEHSMSDQPARRRVIFRAA